MSKTDLNTEVQRYFLRLSYVGTPYAGWQRQPNALGVQQVVEEALERLSGRSLRLVGSSRTDAGVHALGQVAHFDDKPDLEVHRCLRRLNSLLPPEVAAIQVEPKSAQAHARYNATLRRYKYRLHRHKDPFLYPFSYRCPYTLDLKSMNQAAKLCLLARNFKAFAQSGSQPSHYGCHLRQAAWHQEGTELVFTITANRFLRGMVRNMVGTMIEIGRGRRSIQEIHNILESQDRTKAGPSAPPQGLCLIDVQYPFAIHP